MTTAKRISTTLATGDSSLASEWDDQKNGSLTPDDVTISSRKKVWWRCEEYQHSWQATVNNRSRGSGCPYCSNKMVLVGYNDLASNYPNVSAEWNLAKTGELKPESVTSGSNKTVWWTCSVCGYEWQARVADRALRGVG